MSRVPLAIVALCATLTLLALTCASASAITTHPFLKAFGPTSAPESAFSNIQSLAIDQASGSLYVLDTGAAEGTGAIYKFNAAGEAAAFTGIAGEPALIEGVGGTGAGEAQLAVDNSTGPAKGDIYLAKGEGSTTVAVYSAAGVLLGELGEAAGQPWGKPCGVAVDPQGNLYVGLNPEHANKYTPSTNLVAAADYVSSLWGLSNVCQLAADSALNVFVDTLPEGPLTAFSKEQLNTTEVPAVGSTVDATGSTEAVDPKTDDLYVDEQSKISEFGPHGEPFEAPTASFANFGPGQISGSFGIAVDGASEQIYASDGQGHVKVYGPATNVEAAIVTIAAATGVSDTEATLHGTVNPEGTEATSDTHYHFEYSTDEGASFASTPSEDAGTGTTATAVQATITGLIPNQRIEARLVAENEAGPVTSATESFATPSLAPTVDTTAAEDISATHASLKGTLNAHNAATTYFFEYGTTTAYGSSVPSTEDAIGGSANEATALAQNIQGLAPATTYHFRLVAHSFAGTSHGADQSFSTLASISAESNCSNEVLRLEQGSTALPDCRAYEMVSPPEKNGGDVIAEGSRTRASTDGNAAAFVSLTGFGDALGTSLTSEYVSHRDALPGTRGWSTHAILPVLEPTSVDGVINVLATIYVGEFSADLSKAVLRSYTNLSGDPDVAHVANLYLREDLLSPGAGSYQLLSTCLVCGSTPLELASVPNLAGSTEDFGHIIFEDRSNLLPGASGTGPKLYESERGMLRLVGILPESEGGEAAEKSVAGDGAIGNHYTQRTISSDGSRIIFTVPSSGLGPEGDLYQRIDHTSTIKINASERTDCATHNPCTGALEPDPNGAQPAQFETASADGTKIFFTSPEQLTDSDSNGDRDLYMYNTNLPEGHRLSLISSDNEPSDGTNAIVAGVLGSSVDGSYVYFLALHQIVPGGPPLTTGSEAGIFVWHSGTVRYFGTLTDFAVDAGANILGLNYALGRLASRVTPDGKHLLFTSHSGIGLTGYDQGRTGCGAEGNEPCTELYLYSYEGDRLNCVSCNPSGVPATSDAGFTISGIIGSTAPGSHLNHPISDDGRYVFFTTGERLVAEDQNGNKRDVYEYDSTTGDLHLLSTGQSVDDSFFLDASPSGHDVFFTTRQTLLGWDADNSTDLYDARIAGGVPNPPAPPPPCSGDGCHGPVSASSLLSAPPSSLAGSGTNVVPSPASAKPTTKRKSKPRCHRGTVRRRVHGHSRCVRKPKARRSPQRRGTRAKGAPR